MNEKDRIIIHKKVYKDDIHTCVRGKGVIPISPQEMKIFATNLELRKKWDKLFDNGR